MSAADCKAAMAAHAARIAAHYDHARAKHPRFADLMFFKEKEKSFANDADSRLSIWRIIASLGKTDAESVLLCELAEARQAYAQGYKAAAVEECYDAIAVLLRMVDVLEGRQSLGDPAGIVHGLTVAAVPLASHEEGEARKLALSARDREAARTFGAEEK